MSLPSETKNTWSLQTNKFHDRITIESNDTKIKPKSIFIIGVKAENENSKFNILAKYVYHPIKLLEGHFYTDNLLKNK